MLRQCLAEAIGVFALNYYGGNSVFLAEHGASNLEVAGAHALIIAVCIIALEPVSGAHFNPVVTNCFMLLGELSPGTALMYTLSQIGGSVLSAVALNQSRPGEYSGLGYPKAAQNTGLGQSFSMEFIGSAMLLFIVFCQVRAGFPHFSIAASVAMLIIATGCSIGPLGEVVMNPARTIGPALLSDDGLFVRGWWIYYSASFFGGWTGMMLAMFIVRPNEARELVDGGDGERSGIAKLRTVQETPGSGRQSSSFEVN